VRRFYVRDPFGKLINILQHEYPAHHLAGRLPGSSSGM
jgi:hypothetical protein